MAVSYISIVIKESNDIEKLINDTLSEKVPEGELRLPTTLYPANYRLWVYPILDEFSENNFTFTGRVKILINCVQETNKIVLNYDDLNITDPDIQVYKIKKGKITSASLKTELANDFHNISRRDIQYIPVTNSDDEENDENTPTSTIPDDFFTPESDISIETTTLEISETTISITSTESNFVESERVPVKEIVRDKENFKLNIVTENNFQQGETFTVDIKFAGEILNNLVGLYSTNYVDLSGRIKWLATTHFQPIYARRVFPCFDEPKFKAPFEISVARRTNMTALSNMPLKQTEPMNDTIGWVWDHFQSTPPMSTYIVAFTISDFESISANSTSAGPIVKIWAPKDDLSQAYYALNITHELLPFLEDYFGMKYPLPKLDMLAIPNFGKGAMENWGLISFRKSSLLFDTNSRSIRTKSFILAKITHELAHQWFGNLVTMEWWSDLWLNEGFGTFMAEVAITSLRSRWHAYSSIKIRDTYNTLYFDTLKSTHSIQSEIINNAQIEQIFDTIIYQKGSSILKMLNYTLSQDIFRRGIQHYLKTFAYQSSTQDDLWDFFTKTAQNESIIPNTLTVKALMNSWSTQSGYPYITVVRNYSSLMAVINQTKMTEDTNITSDTLWYVPITYITKNESTMNIIWLENTRQTVLDLNGTSNDSWILLNIDETGFYRVNYDTRNWKLLVQQLRRNPSKIPVANRGQLIDDAFQLANAGIINYTIAFDLVKYLYITEPNYIPWYSALKNMEELRVIISNYEYSGLYDNFLLKLVKPMFNELGTVTRAYDTQNEKLLRLHIVTSACKLRYGQCISWARNQYYEWMEQPNPDERNPIPIDYRFITQCSAIKSGGPIEWDFLWNRTLSPSIAPVDLQTAYLSLGCTYDPWLINR
ncbi:hypothetical protein NQ314_019110 [Rhamnusium bicolor]|uniref:Aminopeptidase n=1 Tax=Rhamnusium bicolor TaxID=1586634 RepID=A0AAV8WPA9_9CUCU|nr:hypothetical protein NQ314_019110 [Rhamnusium bicolor]